MKKIEKKEIRAQSQLITTILLIVLVLAAIIIVWAVVNNLITESAEGIGTSALTTRLEIKEAKLWVTGGAKVIVKREPGEGEITSLKFIFYNEAGESVIIEETEKIPKEIETKIYDFDIDEHPELYNINKVSVVPMFGEKAGMEFSEKKPNTDAAVSELVSWWKLDGNAQDFVGGNHGGLENGAKIENNVLVLDGGGNYVKVAHDIDIDLSTFGAWVKPTLVGDSPGMVLVKQSSYYMAIKTTGAHEFCWSGLSDSCAIGIGSEITADEWQHIMAVYNGANMIVYVNGNEIDNEASTGSVTQNDNDVYFGKWPGGGMNDFNGSIDDVMIFNKALTPEEIKAIYNNQLK